jgi:hypothetical protein
MTTKNVKKLEKIFDHKDDMSQRKAVKKFNCSQPFICQTLRDKTNIKVRAKQKSPKYSEERIKVVRTQCKRMLRKVQIKFLFISALEIQLFA